MEGLGEEVQALLRADAGEVTDGERLFRRARGRLDPVAGQVEAERDDQQPAAVDASQVLGHETGVPGAVHLEDVDVPRPFPEHFADAGAPGLADLVEEQVLALQAADHRHAQLPFQLAGEAGEHRVGQVDDVRAEVVAQPGHQLLQLAGLKSLFALEDRVGERSQLGGVGRGTEAGGAADQAGAVEQPGQQAREMAEDRSHLLQVDVQRTVEDAAVAHVRQVGAQRGVGGHEDRVVPLPL